MSQFDFVGRRSMWFAISGLLIVSSIIFLALFGLNFGIDFTGGTLLERGLGQKVTSGQVREALQDPRLNDLDLGRMVIQPAGDDVLIRTKTLTSAEIKAIDEVLKDKFPILEVKSTEVVGAVISSELLRQAVIALVIASAGVLAYVSVRFEFRSGVAAVIALIHDVLFVLGVFALLRPEVNTPFVAAMLTVVGYSINDTIVLFDRIRENLRFRKKEPFAEIVNKSISETLVRSINTSMTTLFVVLALLLLGGTTIRNFALALALGIMVGTYSSIFIAAPLWTSWVEAAEHRAGKAVA